VDTAKVDPYILEDITRVFFVHLKYSFKKYRAQVSLFLRIMAMKMSRQNVVHAYDTEFDRVRLVVLDALLKSFSKLLENNIAFNFLIILHTIILSLKEA
jgi:hypothetical protein